MAQSEEDAAFPFKWKISASLSNQERKTGIEFSWEKPNLFLKHTQICL
jgi:hypothetical protein